MHHAEEIRNYCLQKVGVTESFPFDEFTLVFKLMDKIFVLLALDSKPIRINVKCHPEKAIQQREEFPNTVLPGYHMNKKHWNTIILNDSISASQIQLFIDESYHLVYNTIPKSKRLLL